MDCRTFKVNLEFVDEGKIKVWTSDNVCEFHRISSVFGKKLKKALRGDRKSFEYVGDEIGFMLFPDGIREAFRRELIPKLVYN